MTKRLFWAGALAMSLHAVFLSIGIRLEGRYRSTNIRPRTVSLTLRYQLPQKINPKLSQSDSSPQVQNIPPYYPKNIKTVKTDSGNPEPPERAKPISSNERLLETLGDEKKGEKEPFKPKPVPKKKVKPKIERKPEPFRENRNGVSAADPGNPKIEIPVKKTTKSISPGAIEESIRSKSSLSTKESMETSHTTKKSQAGEAEEQFPNEMKEAVPLYHRNPLPSFPRMARRRGYEGTVELSVLVNSKGKVAACRIQRTSGYKILDDAATNAVRKWVFQPGKRGGTAVEMWVNIPVTFNLR